MKALHTNLAPAAIGPYSQAIEVNGFVFASGQIPIDPATGQFVEGGIKEQTRQALTNASRIMEEGIAEKEAEQAAQALRDAIPSETKIDSDSLSDASSIEDNSDSN